MPPATMLFDADCGLCTHAAAWVMHRAGSGLRALPLQRVGDDPELAQRLGARDLAASLHLVGVDGAISTGAEAVIGVARHVRGWRHLARIVDHPAGHLVLEPVYRVVARNRNHIGRRLGIEQRCAVPETARR